MSFFGKGATPSGQVNPERMEMALQECVLELYVIHGEADFTRRLDMITDVFNKIVTCVVRRNFLSAGLTFISSSSCHSKCVSTRYAEGDLNKGESVCIDRCVEKYFEVNKKVGDKMQAMGASAASAGGAAGGSSWGL